MPLGAGIDVSVPRRAPNKQCLWRSNVNRASRIIASIENRFVIDKMLSHLGGRWSSLQVSNSSPYNTHRPVRQELGVSVT